VLPKIAQDERIGLDERNQLFLLFEDLLEVLIVILGVFLLLKLFYDLYFRDIYKFLQIFP
jgi:hypothetical protein